MLDATAAQQISPKDLDADREFALAEPDVQHIDSALAGEMDRLLSNRPGAPATDVRKYIDTAPAVPVDIGDPQVALHLRLIERERQDAVANIEFAKDVARPCKEPGLAMDRYLDANIRQSILDSVRCHRNKLDRYQAGQHKLLKAEETSLLALKLPPYTQEQKLRDQRARTAELDADLVSTSAKTRKGLQATEDFTRFIDAHAANIRFTEGRLLFDDPDDERTAQNLLDQIKALNE